MLSTKKQYAKTLIKNGFTIPELLVVIAVVAILAAIAIFSYGAWRNQLASDAIKSDLTAAATAMEDARNFESGYPTDVPASYSSSENSTVTYVMGDGKQFCIEGRSKIISGVYFFIDSTKGSKPLQGTCAGGEGVSPQETIFVYDTTMSGCTGLVVQLPVSSPATAPGSIIDWGDGSTEALTTSRQSHTYATAGEKIVKYKGPITIIDTALIAAGSRPCFKEVRQWSETVTPTTLSFRNSTNIQRVATPPNSVTNMANMFSGASLFNQNISSWNTASVTNMSGMFNGATVFNQAIGSWNTSNVTTMANMFQAAKAFNRPLSSWDTSKVTNMGSMFYDADAFNQAIGSWNTANVTNMSYMFYINNTFNQPIGSWNTAKVTDMRAMFYSAVAFNQNIGAWNTSLVTATTSMFRNSPVFNQNISGWDMSKVTNMDYMFSGASAFNQDLSGWNVALVTPRPPNFFDSSTSSWVLPKPVW